MEYNLPTDLTSWKHEVRKELSAGKSQQNVSSVSTSASKITLQDFLLLRVLWKKGDEQQFRNGDILSRENMDSAKVYLDGWKPWQNYRHLLRSRLSSSPSHPAQDIGALSYVYSLQQEVTCVNDAGSGDSEMPKASFTPIAVRTRSHSRRGAVPIYETPTAAAKTALSRADQATNSQIDDDVFTVESPGGKKLAQQFTRRLQLGSVSSEGKMIQTPETPDDTMQTDDISLFSPPKDVAIPAAYDEQVVNMALVSLLSSVTMYHSKVWTKWTFHRRVFHISDAVEARTDGILQGGPDALPLAILEAKARVRWRYPERIQMQEGTQMAAWIASQPSTGHLPTLTKDGKWR